MNRDDKIEASRKRVQQVMMNLLNYRKPASCIDFDVDQRWDTVSAITTTMYRGKHYRVTVEEVIGE